MVLNSDHWLQRRCIKDLIWVKPAGSHMDEISFSYFCRSPCDHFSQSILKFDQWYLRKRFNNFFSRNKCQMAAMFFDESISFFRLSHEVADIAYLN